MTNSKRESCVITTGYLRDTYGRIRHEPLLRVDSLRSSLSAHMSYNRPLQHGRNSREVNTFGIDYIQP